MKFKELREFAERTAKDWMMSVDDVDVIVNEGEIVSIQAGFETIQLDIIKDEGEEHVCS